ncbi:MAG: 5-bromo-4-chloroindolyl phosphate hydrolysis family protein [Clostridia bacterium]|nr:5-bromo-4-chloroindolyl phosphate hydrolysis family protein [Clostridia bacterium]
MQVYYPQYCGGVFFSVPYLALSVGFVPSAIIGVGAFGASELLFRTKKNNNVAETKSLYEVLVDAKSKNTQIKSLIPEIEDDELKQNIREIHETVDKIIKTVEKKPEKYKNMQNFFSYYLPVTIKILNRYDEIENQKLTSSEGKKFMDSAKSMIQKINVAFKNQLSNMYQSVIIDTDAEMKVFDTMLKADGYDTQDDKFKLE